MKGCAFSTKVRDETGGYRDAKFETKLKPTFFHSSWKFCISYYRIWSVCRGAMILSPIESLMFVECFKYPHHMLRVHRKFLGAVESKVRQWKFVAILKSDFKNKKLTFQKSSQNSFFLHCVQLAKSFDVPVVWWRNLVCCKVVVSTDLKNTQITYIWFSENFYELLIKSKSWGNVDRIWIWTSKGHDPNPWFSGIILQS